MVNTEMQHVELLSRAAGPKRTAKHALLDCLLRQWAHFSALEAWRVSQPDAQSAQIQPLCLR